MRAFRLDQQHTSIEVQQLLDNGIFYRRLPDDEAECRRSLEALKTEQGYIEEDIVELRPDNPELDNICARFDKEHFHTADEVRFVLEGAGIFDIRDLDDNWIRVEVVAGDLLVVPANRNHRFWLTDSKHIRCVRLFQDNLGWSPIYRALEVNA